GLRTTTATARPTLVASFYRLTGVESWWSHRATEDNRAASFSASAGSKARTAEIGDAGGQCRVFCSRGTTDKRTTSFRRETLRRRMRKKRWDVLPFPLFPPQPPAPLPLPFFCHFVCMCVCF
ncbi:unnamed protein product, partial [Ixodes hexagonus]